MAMVSPYTQEQVSRAAAQYAITGNIAQAAEFAGINDKTLQSWVKGSSDVSQLFQTLTRDYQSQQGARIRAGLASVVDTAIGLLHDRLANGDEVLAYDSKLGQHVSGKRKMSGKDIGILAAIAIDKRIMLDKGDQDERVVSKADALIARLDRLAEHYIVELPADVERPADSVDVTPDKPD